MLFSDTKEEEEGSAKAIGSVMLISLLCFLDIFLFSCLSMYKALFFGSQQTIG